MSKESALVILVVMLIVVTNASLIVRRTNAGGTVYIRADGSVYPPTAPILKVKDNYYVLTANVTDPIVVERDNIVIDGRDYAIQRTGERDNTTGIDLTARTNVTIRSTKIQDFWVGINLGNSYHDNIVENNMTNNSFAIDASHACYNNIIGNNMTNNGIDMSYSHYNNISRNLMTGRGIYLDTSTGNLIEGNKIIKSIGDSIHLVSNSKYNNIVDNEVENSSSNGISLYYKCDSNCVYRNLIVSNGGGDVRTSGIFIDESRNCTVIGNSISRNQNGVRVFGSSDIHIIGNNIEANINNGIEFGGWATRTYSTENNTIVGNNIKNSKVSINFWTDKSPESVRHNKILDNNITNNQCGISLSYCSGNQIFHNNFMDNTDHVLTNDFYDSWDDDYPSGGNFWDDYNGTDGNQDGIGDLPYVIGGYNMDRYPLIKIIPEFTSFFIVLVFMITTLVTIIAYKRKRARAN
jgi:parallel beta-helix repeat protein